MPNFAFKVSPSCVLSHFRENFSAATPCGSAIGWCDLCDAHDAGSVEYSCQIIQEHKGSVIGDQLRKRHGMEPGNIKRSLNILRKCENNLVCLIFEMLLE